MNRAIRILFFILFFIILTMIFYFWTNSFFPKNDVNILIYASLLLLSFFSLFIEHFFTKPTDVLATSISILLLIIPLKNEFTQNIAWYYTFIIYSFTVGFLSFLSILLFDPQRPRGRQEKISSLFKIISITFGKTKNQYFILFILSLLYFVDSNSKYFLVLFFFSLLIMTDPWKFIEYLYNSVVKRNTGGIGEIFGVQSKNTFLVKLYDNVPIIELFNLVVFKYSLEKDVIRKGIIVDIYLLNQEQWIKVLVDKNFDRREIKNIDKKDMDNNVVYLFSDKETEKQLENLIGIITEDSKIDKIRFIYNGRKNIQDGALINVTVQTNVIYYQVIQGITDIEQLEKKNETGEIIGEAIQLGMWNNEKACFIKYGWVPAINTPVFLSTNDDIKVNIDEDEIFIGKIPDSKIPIVFNKKIALSHHVAILGVTGTGKSVFARYLLKEIIKDEDVKIICVDFTEEYDPKLSSLRPIKLIEKEKEDEIVKKVNSIELAINKNYGKENEETKKIHQEINKTIFDSLKSFIEGDSKIAIFELPDVSNSTGILDYTRCFFRMLFYTAKKEKNYGKRISVLLEEAHTVVPEYNFLGIDDKRSSALVNSVGQIALQGRKYNVGFIVIAQRTANVSKTVLTQCNSIITFQQFDKTSSDFLSNYFGRDIATILPSLKFRQAIAFGKAFRSSIPIVFEVPEIKE